MREALKQAFDEYMRVKAGQSRRPKANTIKTRRKLCKDCKRELLTVKEKTDKRCSFCQDEWEDQFQRSAEMPD